MSNSPSGPNYAICLCVDERMLIPGLFVAYSAKTALRGRNTSVDIIVFTPPGAVTAAERDWSAASGMILRHDLTTSSIDDIEILKRRLSTATLMKLLVPGHLAGCYEKIFYLDADITIHGDVAKLFALEMDSFAVAAVPSGRVWIGAPAEERDWWLNHFGALGMTPPYRFFNAGVMLIHVDNWNRQQLGTRALNYIRNNPNLCFFPDEDALNAVLDGELLELSPIWNMRPFTSRRSRPPINPVVVHFAGPLKPWKLFAKKKRLLQDLDAYQRYRAFIRQTPWQDWLKEQWSFRDFAASVRHEARVQFAGLTRRTPRAIEKTLQDAWRTYIANSRFADVEQGISTIDEGILRLADVGRNARGRKRATLTGSALTEQTSR